MVRRTDLRRPGTIGRIRAASSRGHGGLRTLRRRGHPAVSRCHHVRADRRVQIPALAFWGGTSFVVALFARLYFAGVDRTAFQLVDKLGLRRATDIVLDSYVDLSYGLWRIPVTVSVGATLGMLLLAIGAYRAGMLGLGRSVLLVLPGIGMGVLKESGPITGVLVGVALCVVFIPVGVAVLRNQYPQLRAATTILDADREPRLLSW